MREEAESLRQESQQLPGLEAIRDASRKADWRSAAWERRHRILSGVKLGKQAPEYKRLKAALDRFIREVRSQSTKLSGS